MGGTGLGVKVAACVGPGPLVVAAVWAWVEAAAILESKREPVGVLGTVCMWVVIFSFARGVSGVGDAPAFTRVSLVVVGVVGGFFWG